MDKLLVILLTTTWLCISSFSQVGLSNNRKLQFPKITNDSVKSFDNVFTDLGLFDALSRSKTIFEIRVYFNSIPYTNGHIDVIRASNDSVEYIQYKYSNLQTVMANVSSFTDVQLKAAREDMYKKVQKKKITNSYTSYTSFKKIIEKLEESGFFQLHDQSQILDSLKRKKVVIVDPCEEKTDCFPGSLIFFEIKIGDDFRNFFMLQNDFSVKNGQFTVFKKQHDILTLFRKVFPS